MAHDASECVFSPAGRVLTAFLSAHQAVDAALDAEMRSRLGIGCSHFDVLRALVEAPAGRLRMVDIADRVCLSPSGVTQSVDRLESLGLVSRVSSASDRRLVLATITSAGRSLISGGIEVLESVAERFVTQRLSEREAAALEHALGKLAPPQPSTWRTDSGGRDSISRTDPQTLERSAAAGFDAVNPRPARS